MSTTQLDISTLLWEVHKKNEVFLRRGEFYAGKLRLERDKLPVRKEAEAAPESDQEFDYHYRKSMSLGGPRWNNFAKRWEGEGADEMREKEEVERLVREELRRRKAAGEKAKEPVPPPNSSGDRERGMALGIPLSPALSPSAGREGKTADIKLMPTPLDPVAPPPDPVVPLPSAATPPSEPVAPPSKPVVPPPVRIMLPRYATVLPPSAVRLTDSPALLRRNAIVRAGEPPPDQGTPPTHVDGFG